MKNNNTNATIFGQLKAEHSEVKNLLEQAEKSSEKQRTDLLTQIENELVPHARAEEKTLYALLRQKAEDEGLDEVLDLANEAYEEHRVVDELISSLKKTKNSDEKWAAKLAVLKENIEHHIEEEENELFTKAKSLFSNDELDKILAAYQQSKEQFKVSLPTQSQIKERDASSEAKKIA